MKIAVNPLQCFVLSADGVALALQRNELDVLREVREAGFQSVTADLRLGKNAHAYREVLSTCGLTPAPGYFSGPLSEPAALEDVLTRARSFATEHRELGLTEACLADDPHPERVRSGPNERERVSENVLATVIDAVSEIAAVWHDVGLTACVHNHVGTFIETAAEIEAVLNRTDPRRVRFCPDTGHLRWAGLDPAAIIREYRDRVGLLHVKDLRASVLARGVSLGWGYGGFVRAGLWAEPGFGDVDLETVVAELIGFDGWWIVEVDQTPTASSQDSLRLCAEWAQDLERETARA